MFALATIPLPTAVTIYLPSRGRVLGPKAIHAPRTGDPRVLTALAACFRVNPVTRTIHAELPPLPRPILIYGPDDFAEAAADTPEQHAERVMQVLGPDVAAALQAICDGQDLPPPPQRVPREIPNWRCKAVLTQMGLISQVESIMAGLPEPAATVAQLAWHGDGKVARTGKTVMALSAALGLTDQEVDQLFIAAAGIDV